MKELEYNGGKGLFLEFPKLTVHPFKNHVSLLRSLMDDFVWYECIYPGNSSSFYTNIKTGAVVKNVPQDDPDVARIRNFSCDDNFSKDCYRYISYFMELL